MCPSPVPRIQTKFTRCDVAFIGKVVSKKYFRKDGDDFAGVVYSLKVDESFRGPEKDFIEVYEDNGSARMGLEVKKTYLIIVNKNKNGILQGWCEDAVESTDSEYKKKVSDVKEVMRNIKNGKEGEVIGFVGPSQPSLENGIKGIHFTIKGGGKTFRVISDETGWFRVSVPAGHYKIEPNEVGWKIEVTEFCIEDPDDLDVETAGGADLAFIAKRVAKDRR